MWHTYFMADGERVAEDWGPTGQLAHHYFQSDYQNSIGLVTDDSYSFASHSGTDQNLGYDTFGQPRNPNGSADPLWGANAVTKRGYINQEQLTGVRLIDLNARVYDPYLAKFLSPHPVIAEMGDSQAWNAYAYSRNNPMSGDDPSGLDPDENPACEGACGQGTAPGQSLGGGVSYDPQHNAIYVPAGTSVSVAGAIASAIQGGGSHGAVTGASETSSLSVSPGLSGQYHAGADGANAGGAYEPRGETSATDQTVPKTAAGGDGRDPTITLAAGTTNKLSPDPDATGDHSTFRRAPDGTIQNYETYQKNPATGSYDPALRYRGMGKPHGGVEPPLVLERSVGKGPGSTPNLARPALPSEIPGRLPELPEEVIPDIFIP